jgi:hypothetical protein
MVNAHILNQVSINKNTKIFSIALAVVMSILAGIILVV